MAKPSDGDRTQGDLDPIVPAPWDLKGRGFMFLYRFPKSWAQRQNFLPLEQQGDFKGGFGALMLVDYASSNAGPYRELLFIPGKFQWNGLNRYAISRIWVSTQVSVVSGRANWGIPKQQAEFTLSRQGPRLETWDVAQHGASFFCAKLSYSRLPLPVHTSLIPFPLLQWLGGDGFLTRFTGRGIGRLATLEELRIDSDLFPNLEGCQPLLGLEIEPFFISFPVPQIIGRTRDSSAAFGSRSCYTAERSAL